MVDFGLGLLGGVLTSLDSVLWVLTLGPFWMFWSRLARKSTTALGDRAVQVGLVDVNGEGRPPSKVFRNPRGASELATAPEPGLRTCWDLFSHAHRKFDSEPALGTRTLVKIDPPGSLHPKFPTRVFGETTWMSFREVGERAVDFGKGLKALGMTSLNMKPEDDFDEQKGPFSMLVYENTCAEWFLAMQGAFSQSIVLQTSYATLGLDSVLDSLLAGEVATLMCNKSMVAKVLKKAGDVPSLKNIIYTYDQCAPGERDQKEPGKEGLNVLSFEDVMELGRQKGGSLTEPKPHDVAVVMYTSGSTGKAKGVVIRHSQMAATAGGLLSQVSIQRGSYVAFLPLAHILEMGLEMGHFFLGSKIGYADPKVLAAGPGKCMPTGALETFKPTFLAGVPKVWEGFKSIADSRLEKASKLKKHLFQTAFEAKRSAGEQGRYCPLFDLLVFNKFKGIVGGKLQIAVSGGGAISGKVQEWVRVCLGCPAVQGYGLTETCLGLTLQMLDDTRIGIVGSPISSIEFLVHSEPDLCDLEGKPYMASDTLGMGTECLGRGEVWVRGNNVSSGYYKMKEQTKEVYREDGFFQTGDIGMVLPDGSLKIIDRKKNLVKLKGGEYIALEKMNNAFNNSPFVNKENGGSCAYGDHDLDRPVALVQANEETIMAKAKELGVEGDFEAVVKDSKINKAVLESLTECGKEAGLSSLEQLAGVALITHPWSPADGTMTATFKITPSKIKVVNQKELVAVKPKGIR
eukprot:CAMPEP_0168440976 /NCGR_PEP_ID=MMETSP0228-20121227/43249_1 /TAXON_ID=133427 /ORGANISM="Protoceratium reticulatum, Strain CCCM 535 (=CCMP 1889)" /LENGTH=742 /DNA_ID=CAMNT_0008455281 /DNA_START=59 /DNA_END=2287 /DNA_ORIENTATION=-